MSDSWLSYLRLSDDYERRARFLPAILSTFVLFPLAPALGVPVIGWVNTLLGTSGIAAVLAVGLSHLASAFGNRLQERLWPRWPHDSPTNRWLHPHDSTRSSQQKQKWYVAMRNLTGLDLQLAISQDNKTEIETVINDAVSQLRNRLWNSGLAERLRIHNTDYGFARNLTGLRPVWISFSLVSAATCWIRFYLVRQDLLWPLIASAVLIIAALLAFVIFPVYVRQKAHHYAETYFAAVLELDRESHT